MTTIAVFLLLALVFSSAGLFLLFKEFFVLSSALEACAIVFFVIAVHLDSKVKRERKFPASKYCLEYEIITRGEQTDTVYVLTRK